MSFGKRLRPDAFGGNFKALFEAIEREQECLVVLRTFAVQMRCMMRPSISPWANGLLVLMLCACGHVLRTEPDAQPHAAAVPDSIPLSLELLIGPRVDTTDAFNAEAIACLRRFCAKKLDRDAENDYWDGLDLERFGPPDQELYYAEFDSVGDPRYRATLLDILPAGKADEKILAVRWEHMDGIGDPSKVRYAFDFMARRGADGVRLASPIEQRSRTWDTRQVGPVRYVISPAHTFSTAEAEAQRVDIERLSRFFDVTPFPITYYSCKDPADLFRLKGYQQHPMMHAFPTGGRAGAGGNVFCGNDKDIYTHEIVHLFCQRAFPGTTPPLLEEGLATLLGGSSEHPYAWHRGNLARWLAANDTIDLNDLTNTYTSAYIDEHTNVAYTIGALLCERILVNAGKEELFAIFNSGEDPWPSLARHGITRENLTQELRQQLGRPLERMP